MPFLKLVFNKLCTFSLLALILTACAPTGRYQQAKDSVPSRTPTLAELKEPTPRAETKSRGGNKHYTVRGKYYEVLNSAKNFKEKGIASFYGNKFHGHLTSNGEIYNMYSMSAAHKNLPLPSYVRVKNVENNRSVIVRVNDRGPFHPGRIIDLSYSAAYKLGISGTAKVEIETITDFSPKNTQITPVPPKPKTTSVSKPLTKIKAPFIQILATSNSATANSLSKSLSVTYKKPVQAIKSNHLYRITMGPFNSSSERFLMLQRLKRSGYKNAFSKEMFQP